jgi:hypothetical protein
MFDDPDVSPMSCRAVCDGAHKVTVQNPKVMEADKAGTGKRKEA